MDQKPPEAPETPESTDAPETVEPERRKGRTPKLTVEIGRAIVSYIAAGNFASIAAKLSGVDPTTVERWLRRGERSGEQPYKDFAEAYRRAELEGEAVMVAIWKRGAHADPRIAERFLAKRYPERWSEHAAKLAVLGPEGDGVGVTRFAIGSFTININLRQEPPTEQCVLHHVHGSGIDCIRPEGTEQRRCEAEPVIEAIGTPVKEAGETAPASEKPLTKVGEWNRQIRERSKVIYFPPKPRPTGGGSDDPDNW